MGLFKKLRRQLGYLPAEQIQLCHRAFDCAFDAHRGQTRKSGEAYITHPVAAAVILAGYHLDAQTVMAALLHDTLEDTAVTKEKLIMDFGEEVADLVDGVSKLNRVEGKSLVEYQAENYRKMLLAMARDIRVILVKLADRLHNMRTLGVMRPEKKQRIAQETLDIYAPIAKRLGMRDLSVELEELSFQMMHPVRAKVMAAAVGRVRGHRSKTLKAVQFSLQDALAKGDVSTCAIFGREKHLFSIYRKMRQKGLSFNQVMDVYAFRLIVDSVDQCYRVLGLVHRLYKPVPDRFKDYIAIPKANGYQSLHTTLFGPSGLPLEVQIRTAEMDRMANYGIAAHWLYKSDELADEHPRQHAQRWVKKLMALQKQTGNSVEFIESVKLDFFPEEVYIFTPAGDIMQLPYGATAIDLAYALHVDMGHACVGVLIDRQRAPLSQPLANGQTVEILTSPSGRPNPAWLDMVVTSKARTNLKHYFKNQRIDQAQSGGEAQLTKALAQYQLQLSDISRDTWQSLLLELALNRREQLLIDIGMGDRIPVAVAQRLNALRQRSASVQPELSLTQNHEPAWVRGVTNMGVQLMKCCHPIPGDPIVGVPTHGVMRIHRDVCRHLARADLSSDQMHSLLWCERLPGPLAAQLTLQLRHEPGALARVVVIAADMGVNIDDFQVRRRDGQEVTVALRPLVKDRLQLAKLIRLWRDLPLVQRISRDH